ncbi:MAG: hypothetical protein IPM57_09240 [Oligoflexia bacterium]|nr:hypothetical protein [Oligoflexia bacterium]
MKIISLMHIFIALAALPSFAQEEQEEAKIGGVPAKFATMSKEVSFLCGPFLPNQIEGITEGIPLCGGRFAFKTANNRYLEINFLSGSSKAQRYILGSLSIRGDTAFDDIIASVYVGGDIHYPTRPFYDPTTGIATGDSTSIYFGGHLGGALWAELTDGLYVRSDLKFNLNPGTSLFLGFNLVLRFDPSSDQQNTNQNQ